MVIDRVAEFIRCYQMIVPGDVVFAGFSGGADSVLLLELLHELAGRGGFQVRAVHVHHNLRREEADRDAEFAGRFCEERGIPFFLYSCPVREVAETMHLSLEEAGRLERRRVFRECMEANGGTKLALAHHRNDLAETMIHHLARGTSLSGLAALRPVRGMCIRPLLCLERAEIETELRRRNMDWCEDSTNAADDYTRNGIRHHVIPYLEQKVNRRAVEHMAQTSMDLMEADEYFERKAKRLSGIYCVRRDRELEVSEEIKKEPVILQRYLVRECLELLAGRRKDLGREHLESVLGLLDKQVGKRVSLPYGLEAVRRYDGLVLRKREAAPDPGQGAAAFCRTETGQIREDAGRRRTVTVPGSPAGEADPAVITGEGIYAWRDFQIRVSFPEKAVSESWRAALPSGPKAGGRPDGCGNFKRISENKYTKCFSYDKIKSGLVFRTRKSGDYLTVRADGSRKKLKDYMIDVKIPREQRDSVLLVADGQEIVWVVGYRVSERYRVREDTGTVIQLEVSGGYTNE